MSTTPVQPPYDETNVFAKILEGLQPCVKVYEDEHTLAFMDLMPLQRGHVLVISKARARNLLDVSEEVFSAVAKTTHRLARAVMLGFQADGIMVQQFNERAAGQVVFHLHVHIIPRFEGISLHSCNREVASFEALTGDAKRILAFLAQGDPKAHPLQ